MLDSVEVDGKRVENVRAAVLEGSNLSLLGQAYLSRMGRGPDVRRLYGAQIAVQTLFTSLT